MRKVLFSFLSIAITASMLFVVSCKKDTPSDTPQASTLTTGTLTGKVFAPNGTTPIPMATVFVDVNGEIYLTYTNKDGNFSLKAPSGSHTMYVESGKGKIFRSMYTVDVPKNGSYTFPNGSLKLQQAANLAFIAGAYDNIQDIIINDLGYTCDQLTVADLDNLNTLENYAGLFLNCGKSGALDADKYANLLAFVEGGGSIYASDWAVEYLTGDGYNKTNHPHDASFGVKSNCVGELGGFIDDADLCTDKIGPTTMLYGAEILPADIQSYMGITNIDIEYDLGGWEQVMDLASPPWEVMIQDTGIYGPLAIRLYYQTGSKTPEELMDQGWVTICHIPPGNPANAHTITISVNALPAHLAHGDYVGACQGNGGTIYYTTFHNHVQGMVSPDMQKMLEYFILNL
jgi:hypothetical protein